MTKENKGFGSHSIGDNVSYFESHEEASSFYASLNSGWDKNNHCQEAEAAVDALVNSIFQKYWYSGFGNLAATAINDRSRWQQEAIAINEWQDSIYAVFEDYMQTVTEETALPVEDFILSLPKFEKQKPLI